MNPHTNQFEEMSEAPKKLAPGEANCLIEFKIGEQFVLHNYCFVVSKIVTDSITLTSVGPIEPRKRPTIEELEKILKEPSGPVTINPDGSISTKDRLEGDTNENESRI